MATVDHRRAAWSAAQLALAAGLVFTVLLGGTEVGRLLTPLRVAAAAIGSMLVLVYILRAPREHDLVDLLVLAGLVAFLLTCITSSIPRLSFEAATSAIAYVAAFYVARGAVADPGGRDLAVLVLGTLGAILSILFLVAWGSVWIDWMSVVGAGIPPLDLTLPSAPFAPIRVAILIGLLMPATVLLARRPWIWPAGIAGSLASLALILMSGSRSVWLGFAAAVAVAVALGGGGRILRLPRPALVAGAVSLLAAGFVVGPQAVERLLTSSTLELRGAMWTESLGRWLESPIVGFGPATFPAQFNLTEYYNTFEPWTSHAHNSLIQLLLEGGLVGVLGIGLIGSALVVGIRKRGGVEWAPAAGIAFIVAVSLTENPTLIPYLIVPLIVWAALAVPRTSTAPGTAPNRGLRVANLGLATAAGVAVAATLVAAWSYGRAEVAADTGADAEVISAISTAVNLDPSFPFYRRELGVWLLADGDLDGSREHLQRALELNPADQAGLRAWALLNAADGEAARASAAAAEAQRRADLHVENALTLAHVGLVTGDDEMAMAAIVRAVRREPWLLAAPEWDGLFGQLDKQEILIAARDSWAEAPGISPRNLRARTWLNAMTGMAPPLGTGTELEAEAALIQCDAAAAADALGQLTAAQAAGAAALQARLMYERAFGGAEVADLLTLMAAHDQGLRRQATGGVAGTSAAGDHNRDVKTYSRIPIRPPVGPVLPTPASGLSAWLRDPVAAADLGAPGSGLAECR